MKQKFSSAWTASAKPRKQRKWRANAPLHVKQKLMGCLLSKELRKKWGRRHATVRVGDTVKIMRGQYKKKSGKVERIIRLRNKIIISGIEVAKRDGSKTSYPIHPSNVMITDLITTDKERLPSRVIKEKK